MLNRSFKDSDNWIKSTFVVSLGQDWQSYKELVTYSAQDEVFGPLPKSGSTTPSLPKSLLNMLGLGDGGSTNPSTNGSESSTGTASDGALPVYFSQGKCRDTSLGGNDAINCYYSYNEDDDVTHPFLATNHGLDGMGRVYSEVFDDRQQILYMTFGLPTFNSLTNFYTTAIQTDLAALMNSGGSSGAHAFGDLLGSTIGTFLTLPVLPLVFLSRLVSGIGVQPITKYYDFTSTMPLYYRAVNTIMAHLAVNMGLANDNVTVNGVYPKVATTTKTPTNVTTAAEQIALQGSSSRDMSGLPNIFQTFGFDIYRILAKKILMNQADGKLQVKFTDDSLAQAAPIDTTTDNKSFGEAFFTQFTGQLYDASLYIGFRMEKTTDASEDLSNEVGESSVAQALNAKNEQIKDFKFGTMGGKIIGGAVGELVGGLLKGVGGIAEGLANVVGGGGLVEIMKASGVIDVPEVWKRSSFHKSHNFHFKLRSPYGDPISIFQSIYVPLALLLAGALPRQTGRASYTSPFLCRAYSKGRFAVPLGIIESIHITRGKEQFGWSISALPTAVDVAFTIRDLSPSMYIGIAGNDLNLFDIFGTNSTFQDYLLTLSGMGLSERLRFSMNIRRKVQTMLTIFRDTKMNPFYWGLTLGNTMPAKVLTAINPSSMIPSN